MDIESNEIIVGDLVEYIGLGTDKYCNARHTGIVMSVLGLMFKVKWASPDASPVWYQSKVLKKLNIEKIKKNNLTKSSKMLHYSNNIKELKWK
jgi:hypothetical protein|tara:strand:- start:570 stop:848 length:279 start_codon:yes stop_codon:yes gene_type:complete